MPWSVTTASHHIDMEKLLSTICCTLLACVCEAQTMRVWMKDGSERQFAVSEIESVTFSEERTSMEQIKQEIITATIWGSYGT